MTDTDTVLIEPVANENLVDTDSMPTYYSEDLKRFGLHGKVKTVKTNNYSPFVSCLASPLTFNEEGVLTSLFSEFTDNEISYNSLRKHVVGKATVQLSNLNSQTSIQT